MTQAEAKPRTTYVLPPLSLEFSIGQIHRNRCYIDVYLRSGRHCFFHRQVEAYYDGTNTVPAMVTSSMMSFVSCLVDFEQQRRAQAHGHQEQLRIPFPQWPAPAAS